MERQRSRFPRNVLLWIAINIAASLAILFIVPFPYSLLATIGLFMFIAFRVALTGRTISRMENYPVASSLYIQCLYCGTEHRDVTCPECGSKAKKVSFI